MVRTCQKCRRVNPRDAVYCYLDGTLLDNRAGVPADGSAINLGSRPFSTPFVFPSGRVCRNFVELTQACQAEAAATVELLRNGTLASFLAGNGRTDLALFARSAARAADPQRGLDDFLGHLPFPLAAAKLQVEPALLDLGTLRVGEDRRCQLVLHNKGQRLLYGSAACDVPWLSLGGAAQKRSLFQLTERGVLQVLVLGRYLRAFEKQQEAQIVLDSNGGQVTVAVRVLVPTRPFPEGVLAGALNPRQLAHQAMTAQKETATLIENGAVARWYESNGWTYPVSGPRVNGVAGVQQLFEALGLARAPVVELSEDAIHLRGAPGQKVEHVLTALTHESSPVVAHGRSDQPWLTVSSPLLRGRSAYLALTIDSVPQRPGQTLHAVISVTANGKRRFSVPLTLTISASTSAPLPAPAFRPAPPPPGPVAALPRAITPAVPPMAISAPMPPLALPALPPLPSASGRRSRWLIFLPALFSGIQNQTVSLYDLHAATIDGRTGSLGVYRGKVMLIVNVASHCGFTPQYAGLEALYRKYRDRGLVILGFPCNQFGQQEPGTEAEIRQFCSLNFGVTFPMFAKVHVNGADAHPLFKHLKAAKRGLLGTRWIKWNFTKFLIDRQGTVVKRFSPLAKPERLDKHIAALLA